MKCRKQHQTVLGQSRRALFGILIGSSILSVSCDQAKLAPDQASLSDVRTITDIKGRAINAKIVGRNLNNLIIIKLPGETRHVIPISRLSEQDQNFAQSLPIFGETAAPAVPKKDEPRYNQFKVAKLNELKDEIRELNTTIQELPKSTIKSKSLKKKVEQLGEEAEALEKEIYDLD